MNNIVITGTVGREPETRTTAGGHTYTSLSVEVPKNGAPDKRTFFRVKAWGKASDAAAALAIGTLVIVTGEMQNNRYQAQGSDEWRDSWEVNASAVERLDGADTPAPRAQAPAYQAPPPARPPVPPAPSEEIPF